MTPSDSAAFGLVLKAAAFAADKHREQRRKGGDLPYINHPLAVADLIWDVGGVQDPVAAAAAVLHDTLEDTRTDSEELSRLFGEEIRDLVLELTVDKSLTKEEQKQAERARAPRLSPRARLIRLADKIHNVHSLIEHPPAAWSVQRQGQYADWCAEVVESLRGANERLEIRFQQELERARAAIARRAAVGENLTPGGTGAE